MKRLNVTVRYWLMRILAALIAVLGLVAVFALSAFILSLFLVLAAAASIWLVWQRWRGMRYRRSNSSAIMNVEYEVLDENGRRSWRVGKFHTGRSSD